MAEFGGLSALRTRYGRVDDAHSTRLNRSRSVLAAAACLLILSSLVGLDGSAAGAEDDFIRGEASASGTAVTLAIAPGNTPVRIRYGTSLATYQNTEASSEAKAMDLGLLTVFFGESGACEGSPPLLPSSILPPITVTSSSDPEDSRPPEIEVREPLPPDELGAVIGTQAVNASPSPMQASANTTTVNQYLGLFDVIEPKTEMTTSLENNIREAKAVVTAKRISLLGGLIEIFQPRWEAVARSGADSTNLASFTFKRATVLGFDSEPHNFENDFNNVANGVEGILGFLGVELIYPRAKIEDGKASVSELQFRISNPPIGTDFVTPLLGMFEETVTEARDQLVQDDCNNAGLLQLVDLVLGVLAGTGEITLGIGGVEAFTLATEFPDPPTFGIDAPDLIQPTIPPPVFESPSIEAPEIAPPPVFETPNLSSVDIAPVVESDSLVPDPVDVEAESAEAVDETEPAANSAEAGPTEIAFPQALAASSRYEDGDSNKPALFVGIGGLILALVLAGADRTIMKRGIRKVPN